MNREVPGEGEVKEEGKEKVKEFDKKPTVTVVWFVEKDVPHCLLKCEFGKISFLLGIRGTTLRRIRLGETRVSHCSKLSSIFPLLSITHSVS